MSPTNRASDANRSEVRRGRSDGGGGPDGGGGADDIGRAEAAIGEGAAGGDEAGAGGPPYDPGAGGESASPVGGSADGASDAIASRILASARERRIRIVASRAPNTLASSGYSKP